MTSSPNWSDYQAFAGWKVNDTRREFAVDDEVLWHEVVAAIHGLPCPATYRTNASVRSVFPAISAKATSSWSLFTSASVISLISADRYSWF